MRMFKISAETYAEHCVHTISVRKKSGRIVLWVRRCDLQEQLGLKNMSDLKVKAINGTFNTTNPTKQQTRKYNRWYDGFVYIREDLALKFIKKGRTVESCDFKLSLGFKLHDLIMTEEQPVLNQ